MLESNQHQVQDDPAELNLSIGRIIEALLRRWMLICLIVGSVGAVAALMLLSTPNRYSAVAYVQLEPRDKKITHIDSVISGLKGDTVTIESEVEALRSKTILQRVIDVLDLRNDPEFLAPSPFAKFLVDIGARSRVAGAEIAAALEGRRRRPAGRQAGTGQCYAATRLADCLYCRPAQRHARAQYAGHGGRVHVGRSGQGGADRQHDRRGLHRASDRRQNDWQPKRQRR